MTTFNRNNNKRFCPDHRTNEANHWYKNQRMCLTCKNTAIIADHEVTIATLKDAVTAAISRMNSANGNRDLYQSALRERDLIKKDLKRAEDFALELAAKVTEERADLVAFTFKKEREHRPFVQRNSKIIVPKRLRRLAQANA